MTTGWGYYLQGTGKMVEVDELGSKLSTVIGCPIHFPAFGKNLYECRCGVIFPLYLVKTRNWKLIKQKHIEEGALVRR